MQDYRDQVGSEGDALFGPDPSPEALRAMARHVRGGE
jgi:hypothetical protein